MLRSAARHADIVGLVGFTSGTGQVHTNMSHWSWDGLAERIAFVRAAAGDRFGRLELNVLVQRAVLTDDRERAAAAIVAESGLAPDILLHTAFAMFGSESAVRAHVDRLAELGIGFVTVFQHSAEALAPLLQPDT